MTNKIDDILKNISVPTSIETLNGVNERAEKLYIQKILNALFSFSKYSDLPWKERIQVSVFPNEYSNIFSFNRCLSRLLENDLQLFESTGNYNSITLYNDKETYNEGDRVIAYNAECHDSKNLYKIYVCLKNKTKGIKPNDKTSLKYYESLVIPKSNIPSTIYWAEDNVTLDSFNTDSLGLSWDEFNSKNITELDSFNFNNINTKFNTTETYEGSNLRRLEKPMDKFNWPSNTPVIYSDFAVSNLLSANPGILLYKNDDELITTSTEIDGDDYIVSTMISSYYVGEMIGITWAKIYKSGWVEQGGIQPIIVDSSTSSKTITQGNETYLIGISPDANMCIKTDINMLMPSEILSLNYSINEVSVLN